MAQTNRSAWARATPGYLCGVDIGGTFTDCVVVDESGAVVTTKAPSTPHDFSLGMMAALEESALKLGLSLPEHGYHAPNENFDWGQARGGMMAFAALAHELAATSKH